MTRAHSLNDLSDVKCAIDTEVSQTASQAAYSASVLESIGARAFEVAGVLSTKASGDELLRKAHEVSGLVVHALGVLAELQMQAGRMQTLAVTRRAMEEVDAL